MITRDQVVYRYEAARRRAAEWTERSAKRRAERAAESEQRAKERAAKATTRQMDLFP
jgi:hypothetical protein